MKELIDEKICEFLSSLPTEEQVQYKYIYDYRGMASDGTYWRVTNEVQRLEVTDDNYLALGIIEIAPNQSENLPVRVQMKHCITGEIIPIKIEEEDAFALTPREKEILSLASQGFSSKEIAEKLLISTYTVNRHRQNIREKFNAESLIEAIDIARRKGVL